MSRKAEGRRLKAEKRKTWRRPKMRIINCVIESARPQTSEWRMAIVKKLESFTGYLEVAIEDVRNGDFGKASRILDEAAGGYERLATYLAVAEKEAA